MNTPVTKADKRAEAARRLRKRLEAQQTENDAEAKNISKPLWWFAGAVVIISTLALVVDIIAGLWQWFVDILTGIPLWVMIMMVMAAAYLIRVAKGGKLRRKIRKLREMEKDIE
ncbi:MAG: hypothetical protein ACR2P4_01225 [Gammaproteobacteria bacterium]